MTGNIEIEFCTPHQEAAYGNWEEASELATECPDCIVRNT